MSMSSVYSESVYEAFPEAISERSEEESMPEDNQLSSSSAQNSEHKRSIYPISSVAGPSDIEQFSVSTDI